MLGNSEEFIMNRCEEILDADEEYSVNKKETFLLNNEFVRSLSQEQLKKYLALESAFIKLNSHAQNIIYKQGNLDRQK